jgi:hypothetical protein
VSRDQSRTQSAGRRPAVGRHTDQPAWGAEKRWGLTPTVRRARGGAPAPVDVQRGVRVTGPGQDAVCWRTAPLSVATAICPPGVLRSAGSSRPGLWGAGPVRRLCTGTRSAYPGLRGPAPAAPMWAGHRNDAPDSGHRGYLRALSVAGAATARLDRCWIQIVVDYGVDKEGAGVHARLAGAARSRGSVLLPSSARTCTPARALS